MKQNGLNSSLSIWDTQVDNKIKKDEKDYAVLFLLKDENLYTNIKMNSLWKNGYVIQLLKKVLFIKVD